MNTPVAIAGAGPVGLALACALGHHGVGCVVLEEDEALSRHSKAPGVLPRTLEIFRAWGVLDRFLDAGTLVTRPRIWSASTREPIVTIDFGPLEEMTSVPGLLVIPQNRTEALLRDHAAARGLADLRFGHRVTGFEQAESGGPVGGPPVRVAR